MSASELFDLIRPAAQFLSALLSTWVFASARRRFSFFIALLWAIMTMVFPFIVFPLYLIAVAFRPRRYIPSARSRFALPLLYAAIALGVIGLNQYLDERSADAYLARATQAKVSGERSSAINEYRRALEIEDDPHTHKLLAIELADSGNLSEAITEFRKAQKGGEPDDSIYLRLGSLLELINHTGEARLEYQKYLLTPECMRVDNRCGGVRQRLEAGEK